MYEFELEAVADKLKKRNVKKIMIQLPEGLKNYAIQIIDDLSSKVDADFVLSGDPCYGACDIRRLESFDTCVHFGHSKMIENDKVIYVPVKDDIEFADLIDEAIKKYNLKKPGIVTTIQHVHLLPKKYKLLKGARSELEGQVLGCDFQTINIHDVDGIIFIGSGNFHAQGIKSKTNVPVIKIDPYDKTIEPVESRDFEKEKYLRITKAMNANLIAVVIGEKPGQQSFAAAEKAVADLKEKGKKAYKVILENCSPNIINYLPFDAFVITACPRIVLDDWKNYEKPILLPEEIGNL